MRKRPPLCTRRAPLTWGGARLAGENASIRECPCLRRIACSGAVVRPACGSAPTPMCRGIAGGAAVAWGRSNAGRYPLLREKCPAYAIIHLRKIACLVCGCTPTPACRAAGGCPYSVVVIPTRPCLWRGVVCRVRTVFPGHGVQDTQRGQKGHCPLLGSCFGGLVLRLCRFGVIPPRKRVRQCRRRICAYPQKSAVGLRGQGVSVSLCLRGNPASPDVGARGPYPDRGTCRSRGGSPLPGMSPMPPRRIPAA